MLSFLILFLQQKGLCFMILTDSKKYKKLLKEENDRLAKRISQLEKERDYAVKDMKRSAELLNTYKKEYERLIQDSKKLIQKQKSSEKAVDKIINGLKKELSALQKRNA